METTQTIREVLSDLSNYNLNSERDIVSFLHGIYSLNGTYKEKPIVTAQDYNLAKIYPRIVVGLKNLKLDATECSAIPLDLLKTFLEQLKMMFQKVLSNPTAYIDAELCRVISDFIVKVKNDKYSIVCTRNSVSSNSCESRHVKFFSKDRPFHVQIAREDERFIVSNGNLTDYLVYFDAWQSDQDWIVKRYLLAIEEIEKKIGDVSHICLVMKQYGPQGPMLFQDQIKAAVKKKDFLFYNQFYKNFESINGELNLAGKKVVILYDLLVTGEGLSSIRNKMKGLHAEQVYQVVTYRYYEFKGTKEDSELISTTKVIFDDLKGEEIHRQARINAKAKSLSREKNILENMNQSTLELSNRLQMDPVRTVQNLYQMTKQGELSLASPEGRKAWTCVIEYYTNKNQYKIVQEIYDRLADINKNYLLRFYDSSLRLWAYVFGVAISFGSFAIYNKVYSRIENRIRTNNRTLVSHLLYK